MMNKFEIGEKVKIATQPNTVFEIVEINPDRSYEIQHYVSDRQIFKYGNIATEMLKKIENGG